MAQLTPGTHAVLAYQAGAADKVVLIALRDVTDGDTLDLGGAAAGGLGALLVINRAVCIGVTQFVAIAVNWTDTTVTIPPGMNHDAGYLLAWGSGAS